MLANGYNHPPTHLSHMQFMQLGGHPGAGHTAILSPASLPHHLQAQAQARAEQGLKVNQNMANMEALARWVGDYALQVNHLCLSTSEGIHSDANKLTGFIAKLSWKLLKKNLITSGLISFSLW